MVTLTGLTGKQIADIFADVPTAAVAQSEFFGEGLPLLDLLSISETASSKGEARRLIKGGGISVNNQKMLDEKAFGDPGLVHRRRIPSDSSREKRLSSG